MYKDRHARVEKICENCGNAFMARVERVNKGKGRFCSLKCANEVQRKELSETVWGFENGKKYFTQGKWVVSWYDEDGQHNTSYPKWWWTINVGEVPDGFVVSFVDKNQENINPDNFHLLPKGKIWVENGKGNKARTGMKWSKEKKLEISNRVKKDWAKGKYDGIHIGENHYNWKGGKSKEEYPPEFYAIREFILDRDHYQCRICGKSLDNPKFAHVHHRDANKQHNEQNNLISLCIYCHSQVHSNKDTSSETILALRSELYS